MDRAVRYRLDLADADISERSDLIELGNHSHSHYILNKLNDADPDQDLRCSHEMLENVLGESPEAFAYPFGIPETHFDERCSRSVRAVKRYPYIFSATDSPLENIYAKWERPCSLDNIGTRDAVGTVAKVNHPR